MYVVDNNNKMKGIQYIKPAITNYNEYSWEKCRNALSDKYFICCTTCSIYFMVNV